MLIDIDPCESEHEWHRESAEVLTRLLAMPAVARGNLPRAVIEDLTPGDQEAFYASLAADGYRDGLRDAWLSAITTTAANIMRSAAAAKRSMVTLLTSPDTTMPVIGADVGDMAADMADQQGWPTAMVVGTIATMVSAAVLVGLTGMVIPAWAGMASNLGPALAWLGCGLVGRNRAGKVCAGWLLLVIAILLVTAVTR